MSRYGPMRNRPCPCGSGRKTKRCCRAQGPPLLELEYDVRPLDPGDVPSDLEPIDFSRPDGMRVVTVESSEGPGVMVLPASATEIPAPSVEWLKQICTDPEVRIDGHLVHLDEHEAGPLPLPSTTAERPAARP